MTPASVANSTRPVVMASKPPADTIIWCDPGIFRCFDFGFCPSKKAWEREYPDVRFPVEGGAIERGAITILVEPDEDIVMVGSKVLRRDVAGYLVHEAMHVYQHLIAHIGETNPSKEFEAYQVQTIFENLLAAYEIAVRPILRSPLGIQKVAKQ
jgi:hypothetical protein